MTRLSSNDVIIEYRFIEARLWRDRVKTASFSFCTDRNCLYRAEHEYRFDGQFFYKKR